MTAVEHLVDKIESNTNPELTQKELIERVEQAKEMEKQQQGYSEEDMEEYAEFCIKCDRLGLPCIIAKDWFKNYKK